MKIFFFKIPAYDILFGSFQVACQGLRVRLLLSPVSASGFQGVCPEPRSDKDSLWVASLSNSKQTIFHGELFAREIILVLTSFLNTFDEFPDAPLNLLVL